MARFIIDMPVEDRLYSKGEVANLLGVSENTIDKLIVVGRFPRGIKATRQTNQQWAGSTLACWLAITPMMQEEAGKDGIA